MIIALKLALKPAQESILFFIKLVFPPREVTYYTVFLFPITLHPFTLSVDDLSSHLIEAIQIHLETLSSSLYLIISL